MSAGQWFPGAPLPDARVRVFAFPHAGGSASAYGGWRQRAGDGVEIRPVQYPGRAGRYREPMPATVPELAAPIAAAIAAGFADLPIVLFGHSMGALVAFEVAAHLEREHGVVPARLIVSGSPAPHLPSRLTTRSDAPEAELVAGLRELGGSQDAVLDDPEILQVVLPMLRADLALGETYRPHAGSPVGVPVTALSARDDALAPPGEVAAWEAHTTGPFDHTTFPGDHFYLYETPSPVLPLLAGLPARTEADAPPASVLARFEERARVEPGAEAVVDGESSLSYGELDARADALAHVLRTALAAGGAPDEPVVAVRLPRGLALVTALLAVLKAGAAYLPLDPGLPRARTEDLVVSSGARLLLTDTAVVPGPIAAPATVDLAALDLTALDLAAVDLAAADLAAVRARGGDPARPADRSLAYVIHTSGSTGRPKPVAVEHRSLAHHTRAVHALFGLTARDRVLQFTNPGFDVYAEEVFPTLAAGACVVVLRDSALAPAALEEFLRAHRVTLANLPTPYWTQWTADLDQDPRPLPPSLRLLVVGSDTTHTRTLAAWRGHSDVPVANAYGLTETTITATAARYDPGTALPGTSTLSIGEPLAGTTLHIVDAELRPCPPGEAGELYIGGEAVARGYLGRPAATAERFVPDPFAPADRPGSRLYRTGDLALRLPDGTVEFLGRVDHQVKIRGHRVEPAEVEAVLARDPGVTGCAVLPVGEGAALRLIAYVVGPAGAAPDLDRLRAHAGAALPSYAVPADYVVLDALPVTSQGKLDRRALPAPSAARAGAGEPPRGPDEERVARVWQEVIGSGLDPARPIARDDDFFDLGGNSLHMVRVLGRLRQDFGVPLTAREFTAARTPRRLAAEIEAARSAPAAERAAALLPAVPEHSAQDQAAPGEQRLWFLGQLRSHAAVAYNVPTALRLRGPLDPDLLRTALETVASRHPRLRASFHYRDDRIVVDTADRVRVDLPVVDVTAALDPATAALRLAEDLAAERFALDEAPLLRASLFRTGPEEHLLALVLHHLVCDGVSVDVIEADLAAAYAAHASGDTPAAPPASGRGYREYARWQRELPDAPAAKESLDRVLERLRGAPVVLALPTDRERPRMPSHRGRRLTRPTPAGLLAAVTALASAHRTTPYAVALAALGVVLHGRTGQEDLLLGSPTAGRPHPDLDRTVGFFVNTVVVRLRFAGDPDFASLLRAAHEEALAAIDDEYVPIDRLVSELVPERDPSRTPLVQAVLAYQGPARAELRLTGSLTAEAVPLDNGTAKFDLTLDVEEVAGELVATLEYSTDLFEERTVTDLLDRWVDVLSTVVDRPDTPVSALLEKDEVAQP